MLFFPVYALLFVDAGLSPAQISSLFVIWALVTMVLEVPSGAWADVYSRRHLLALAGLVRAAGFALWTVLPAAASLGRHLPAGAAYWTFAAGFVLWGVRSALSSGAREALLYDELAALDAADGYPAIAGRAEAVGIAANLVATALAAPALAVGGFGLVGAASVLACLGSALVAVSFPARPRVSTTDGGLAGYLSALHSGLAEVRHRRTVRRAALLAAAVPALAAFDEYLPLLAGTLVALPTVPLLLLVQVAAMTLGSLAATRWWRLAPARLAGLLALAAGLLAAGALADAPAGFVGVAACFGVVQLARVLSNARLQQVISGSARATVLSVAGAGAEVGALLVFAAGALGLLRLPVALLVAGFAVPWLAVAALTPRWLPPPAPAPAERPAARRRSAP